MSGIRKLDDSTSRLLESGQYIIDCVSLVKELIDNALDAGATSIDVEIASNAIDLVQVKDNGHGVRPADVDLLARQGCTSKIRSYDDLLQLGGRYLGFRGMALSSIARLSGTMEIYTRVDTEPAGLRLQFSQKGEIIGRVQQARNPGTTIKIKDFLAWTPVRQQAAKKECTKQLLKAKELVQTYALVHEAHQRTVVEATRNVFGTDLVSDCETRHWSSRLGFVETEEPDLHMVEDEHYAITALLLRPETYFTKRNEHGQYCSIDFRPVAPSRGTMKKIVAIYRVHLQQSLQGDVKNPFLCLNIMCPAGSYDPNIEPTKDVVAFAEEDKLLEAIETFFQAVYATRSEDRAISYLLDETGLCSNHLRSNDKLWNQISEISNSTARSNFSSDINICGTVPPGESEHRQEPGSVASARSSTILAEEQSFVDISRLNPSTQGRDRQRSATESGTQDLSEDEDEILHVFTDPWDATRISAGLRRRRADKAKRLAQVVPNLSVSIGSKEQSLDCQTTFTSPSDTRNMPMRNASFNSGPSMRPSASGFKSMTNASAGQLNGGFISSIRGKAPEIPTTSTQRGPLDTYFRPSIRRSGPEPLVYENPPLGGIPLSQIPIYAGRKRKLPISSDAIEALESTSNTPSKRLNLQPHPTKPRVSFAPIYSSSPRLPTSPYRQSTTTSKPTTGPVTPNTSPLKQQSYPSPPLIHQAPTQNICLAQVKTPLTPVSIKKPSLKRPIIRLPLPNTQGFKALFCGLAKYDAYTAGKVDERCSGFDLSGMPDAEADGLVLRCQRAVQGLMTRSTQCDGRVVQENFKGMTDEYEDDLEMDIDVDDEIP